MKLKLVWFVLLIRISWSGGQNNKDYDYLKLALLWPNSYCLTDHQFCRDEVPQYFTVAGLWPERRGGHQPQYCPSSYTVSNITVEKEKVDLLNYWPDLSTYDVGMSEKMWTGEWKKHGSCSDASLLPDDYFQCALDRTFDHNLSQILTYAGIKANGKSYEASRILNAVRRGTGLIVDVICESDRMGNVYLSEIHQCINYNGKEFIDCENLANNCDADPIFPPSRSRRNKPPSKHRKPPTPCAPHAHPS